MIPNTLASWTLEAVIRLVVGGYEETQTFDFKEDLSSHNPQSRKRLEASACAFANTEGGFLVFGIVDRTTQPDPTRRVLGIEDSRELPREFGDRLSGIRPTLFFDFKNPPIPIRGTNRVVHVIHVPLSSERPHVTSDAKFYYRDAKGANTPMPYEMIRESFLRFGERLEKLRALHGEIALVEEQVHHMAQQSLDDAKALPVHSVDLMVLNIVLVNAFPLIRRDQELLSQIQALRRQLALLRAHAESTQQQLLFATGATAQVLFTYKQMLAALAPDLCQLCRSIMAGLERITDAGQAPGLP